MGYLFKNETVRKIEEDFYKTSKSNDVLMDLAGLAVANEVISVSKKKDFILVLTGSGNNGGDGYFAARVLHQSGYRVRVCEILPSKSEPPSSSVSLEGLPTLP